MANKLNLTLLKKIFSNDLTVEDQDKFFYELIKDRIWIVHDHKIQYISVGTKDSALTEFSLSEFFRENCSGNYNGIINVNCSHGLYPNYKCIFQCKYDTRYLHFHKIEELDNEKWRQLAEFKCSDDGNFLITDISEYIQQKNIKKK